MISKAMSLAAIGALVATAALLAPPASANGHGRSEPELLGRAVLPVYTLAPGPPSGAGLVPAGADSVTLNGITFPLPSQPVEGFSGIIDGRSPGEYLAMPDNGYGSKSSSRDFLIRAYYIRPDFKTARGGTGNIEVGSFIQFRDPDDRIGFPIVNEGTADRLLTGADIDPESIQRDKSGDLWLGDEFGPWLLHFDPTGRLLDAPFPVASPFPGVGDLMSPNNPFLNGQPATQPNSRGFESMAISPNGKFLYAALEGATVGDPDQSRRLIFEFSLKDDTFTGRTWQYRVESNPNMLADMAALDEHRLALIERDGGLGATALFRHVYVLDLRYVGSDGFLVKRDAVDLTKIPDPNLISLPPIHVGDLGLGNPFWVMCESVEDIHPIEGHRILIGCDNNLPNKGRNPDLADDNEIIVVDLPQLG